MFQFSESTGGSDPAPDLKPQSGSTGNGSSSIDFSELQRREAELALREAAFARREGDVTFVEQLVSQGRLVGPQMKTRAIALLQAAPTSGVAFSENGASHTLHGLLKQFFSELPVQVQYGEFSASDGPKTSNQVTAHDIQAKANELVSQQPGLRYSEATRKAARLLGVS
jgi:hypothetical protein